MGSRGPSVGGTRGFWPQPLLQEQLEASGVHMRSEPLVFMQAEALGEHLNIPLLSPPVTVCYERLVTVF